VTLNQLATKLVQKATSDQPEPDPYEGTNPAVELGRLGGQKGGKACAAKLTPGQRSEIAKRGAVARWSRDV
jgi:hypothetical protein